MKALNIKDRVEEIFEEIVSIRRDFHKHPELSGKEIRTGKKICQYLDQWGIEYETGIADTGIVGIIRGKKGTGKTIAIRADIDALPIKEIADYDYGSVNDGVMHACGHDVHTAILLSAGKLLKEMENELKGNVKLFFQPAEEAIGGADRMIKDGCLENPKVDHVIGLHVMPNVDVGKVELKYGKLNGNSGSVKITINGKSGHAAYPDKAVDAIVIAGHVITSLQTLVSRNVSPLDSVVLTFGKIYGGEKANIITDKVILEGTLRTLATQSRVAAKEKIKRIAENVSLGLGGSAEVAFKDGYIALINDDYVVDVMRDVAIKILGEENIVYKEFPSMGGEDFSYFADKVPSAFFHLGCRNEEKGIVASLHNKQFMVDEDCMKIGIIMQVNTILALLNEE
ncbi:MAG: amidohydrolase [Marinisporobacter sp.]|jgi:amidohydrolase|nr:amidohydrolase [Marinisporobacter sp.]